MQTATETQPRIVPTKHPLMALAQRIICKLSSVSPEVTNELLNVLAKAPITKPAIELNTETVKNFTEESLLSGQPYSIGGITIQCLGEKNKFSIQISPNVNIENAITSINQLYMEQHHGGILPADVKEPLMTSGEEVLVHHIVKASLAIPKSFIMDLRQHISSTKYCNLLKDLDNTSGHTIIFSEKLFDMESRTQERIFKIMQVKEANHIAVGLLLGITSLAKDATGNPLAVIKKTDDMYTGRMQVNMSAEGYRFSFPENEKPRTTIISPVK